MDSDLQGDPKTSPGDERSEVHEEGYGAGDGVDGDSRSAQISGASLYADAPIDASVEATGLSGQTLDHYEIQRRLGGGAMAAVYQARDNILDQPVALKVLLPGADGVTRERFRREARLLATLVHPHIIPTYQVGQSAPDGTTYIAMELVTGQSLADLLTQETKMHAHDACALLAPIAHALDYAHHSGVIHRDVKPSNILLRRVGELTENSVRLASLEEPIVPLLSDFGIALALDAPELTSAGRTIGTPAFMSPEQCAGNDEIDGRADIYSLGAVLYRCVVGRAPFRGSTTQILHAHVYDPLLIPEPVLAQVPAKILQIIQRSMAKEPAARYQRASEMASDLEELLRTLTQGNVHQGQAMADATMTLDSLPVGSRPESTHVLVPAPDHTPQFGLAPTQSNTPARIPLQGPKRPPVQPTPRPTSRPAQPNRAGIAILGVALVVLLGLLSLMMLNSVLPGEQGAGLNTTSVPAATSAAASTGTGSPSATDDTGEFAPVAASSATKPTPDLGTSGTLTPIVEPATVTATTQPTPVVDTQPTPVVDKEWAWDLATTFHAEREWTDTRDWLLFLRRVDPEFERDLVSAMFVDAYVGLATAANRLGDFATGEMHLAEATSVVSASTSLDTESSELFRLYRATADVVQADSNSNLAERQALQRAHVAYADWLENRNAPCIALEHLDAAISVLADVTLASRRPELEALCSGEDLTTELLALEGSLVYSSESNGQHGIYWMPVEPGAGSVQFIDNGAQPAIRPDGGFVAFHSTRSDWQGLVGVDLTANLNPNDRSVRYTDHVEDARESPPSWSKQGDRLVFASTSEGDGKSRVYWVWADGSRTDTFLGLGRDPAWHPFQDLIVYNGVDESGDKPGLWLVQPDGNGRTRLTNNGNDIRPTWSRDGQYVVFMSKRDGNNWDLYRVDVTAPANGPIRLTTRAAQDGVPTIGPNDEYIAFLSDQDGFWRIWFIPFEGGEAQPLGTIVGTLPSWLDHGIQWIQ